MNDRFKFRVFDTEEKHYIPNSEVWLYPFGELWGEWGQYSGCRFIIEQCTGLSDKNGKLIYEGDVLVFVNGATHPIIVTWNGIGWKFIRNGKRIEDAFDSNTIKHISMCETIGNIHNDQFRNLTKKTEEL